MRTALSVVLWLCIQAQNARDIGSVVEGRYLSLEVGQLEDLPAVLTLRVIQVAMLAVVYKVIAVGIQQFQMFFVFF